MLCFQSQYWSVHCWSIWNDSWRDKNEWQRHLRLSSNSDNKVKGKAWVTYATWHRWLLPHFLPHRFTVWFEHSRCTIAELQINEEDQISTNTFHNMSVAQTNRLLAVMTITFRMRNDCKNRMFSCISYLIIIRCVRTMCCAVAYSEMVWITYNSLKSIHELTAPECFEFKYLLSRLLLSCFLPRSVCREYSTVTFCCPFEPDSNSQTISREKVKWKLV